MVGTKIYKGPGKKSHFIKQWHDPEIFSELHSLGLISPEQFGSLFIADGERLNKWLADSKPLVDNFPKRLSSKNPEWKKYLSGYLDFMDKDLSKQNFMTSETIRRFWPESMRQAAEKHFAPRDIINDMLSTNDMRRYATVYNLHHCINDPLLTEYIPWAFHSDQDAINIIDSQLKLQNDFIYEDYLIPHLAASAAQKGNFLDAEKILALYGKEKPNDNLIGNIIFRTYLLFSFEKKEDAKKVLQEYINKNVSHPEKVKKIMKFWNWLNSIIVTCAPRK